MILYSKMKKKMAWNNIIQYVSCWLLNYAIELLLFLIFFKLFAGYYVIVLSFYKTFSFFLTDIYIYDISSLIFCVC